MSAGYELKQAEYIERPLSEDEMWSAFAFRFSSKAKNYASDKFGFLKSILDKLYNIPRLLAFVDVHALNNAADGVGIRIDLSILMETPHMNRFYKREQIEIDITVLVR